MVVQFDPKTKSLTFFEAGYDGLNAGPILTLDWTSTVKLGSMILDLVSQSMLARGGPAPSVEGKQIEEIAGIKTSEKPEEAP